jgi:hypothetical protein
MARFTATAAVTVTSDWDAGDFLRFDKFRDQVGQNLEFLMQSHDHSGDLGDGASLSVSNPWFVAFIAPPLGAPFC